MKQVLVYVFAFAAVALLSVFTIELLAPLLGLSGSGKLYFSYAVGFAYLGAAFLLLSPRHRTRT